MDIGRHHVQGKTIAAAAVGLAVLLIAPAAHHMVGYYPAFLPSFFTAVLLSNLATAALLWQQYEARGESRLLGLATTYLFSGLLVIPHVLTFPQVVSVSGWWGATPSTSIWFWVVWHAAFPVGLALSLLPVPRWLAARLPADRRRAGRLAIVAAAGTVTACTVVFTRFEHLLPEIIRTFDYSYMTRTIGPVLIVVNLVSLVIVRYRSRRTDSLERWVLVAAAASAGDTFLSLVAESRFTVGWYSGRALALVAGAVVLVGLGAGVSRLYKEMETVNVSLLEANQRDTLTGVFSRAAILDKAEILLRRHEPMAVAIVDLDHFKAINDTYGHQTGDQVLRETAQRMASSLRGGDIVGRIGGEEFVIVFLGVDAVAASTAGERVRAAVSAAPVKTSSGDIHVTASVGIATQAPDDLIVAPILSRADSALYDAKGAGRDRVRLALGHAIEPA